MYEAKHKFALTPEKMAETYTWLAAQNVTGGYWNAPGVAAKANKKAYNKETWAKLWEATQALIRE